MTREDLAAILKSLRLGAGLSQAALGKAIGKPSSTISRIENAELDATIELIGAWARACGKDATLQFADASTRERVWPLDDLPPPLAIPLADGLRNIVNVVKRAPAEEGPVRRAVETAIREGMSTAFSAVWTALVKRSPTYFTEELLETVNVVRVTQGAAGRLSASVVASLVDEMNGHLELLLQHAPVAVHRSWTVEDLARVFDKPASPEQVMALLVRSPPTSG